MFRAATHQFVESVGKKTLHPTPTIDEAQNVKLGQLVVKTTKRHFIFFEKASFHPSDFQLTDVATDTKPLAVKPESSTMMTDYNRTTKLSLKGKFGAELTREIIDVDLEGKDAISVDIKFKKVTKSEFNEPDLMVDLNKRHINMDHPLIKQIREDRRKSLCIITGVVQLPQGGSVHRMTNGDLVAKASSSLVKNTSVDGEVQYDKDRDIEFPPDMAIAYHLHELNVHKKTGAIQMVLAEGLSGGFQDCIGYDEVDATSDLPSTATRNIPGHNLIAEVETKLSQVNITFSPISQLPEQERGELTTDLLSLLSAPRDVHFLHKLVESTEQQQQNKVTVSDMADNMVSEKERWLHLLTSVGFKLQGDVLVQPLEDPPLLQCLGEFLDAASMLSDEEVELICGCSSSTAHSLLSVLGQGMKGGTVSDTGVTSPVLKDDSASKLLLQLQFRIAGDQIVAPEKLAPSIDEVYWIVYCLWGNY